LHKIFKYKARAGTSGSGISYSSIRISKNIQFLDSYAFITQSLKEATDGLNLSLKKVCASSEDFETEIIPARKLDMDFKFFSLTGFNNASPQELEHFKNYLNMDAFLVCCLFKYFQKFYFLRENIDMSKRLTLPAVAFETFWRNYYEPPINMVPENSNLFICPVNERVGNYIRTGYAPGRTEIFCDQGHEVFHWDVNSQYPFVMRENKMPSGPALGPFTVNYPFSFEKHALGTWFFGWAEAEIWSPLPDANFVPVLGLKHRDLGHIFPCGHFKGTFFSEELKEAKRAGYRVLVKSFVQFETNEDFFKKFVVL
jgi:hypothetical protein